MVTDKRAQAAIEYLVLSSIVLTSIVCVLALSSGMLTMMRNKSENEIMGSKINEVFECIEDSVRGIGTRSVDLGELPRPVKVAKEVYAVSVLVKVVGSYGGTVLSFCPYSGAFGEVELIVGHRTRGVPYYLVGERGACMTMFDGDAYVLVDAVEGGVEIIKARPLVGLEYSKLPVSGGNWKHGVRIHAVVFENTVRGKEGVLTFTPNRTERLLWNTVLGGDCHINITTSYGPWQETIQLPASAGDELTVSTIVVGIWFDLD